MEMKNLRQVYGETLIELGKIDPDVVVLEADLGRSTMSLLFQNEFPQRYFEMGIAEQNMTSFAAGLAFCGKKPFINSFAIFSTGRAFDQIRQSICIPNINVVINGSSCALSDFGDGATHQSIEDSAIMRALPNMTVFCPTDAIDTRQMVFAAVELSGPCYLKLPRSDMPTVMPADYKFEAGKPYVMREGKDAVVFACGTQVYQSMIAAGNLAKEGIQIRVVNVNTLKPLCDDVIQELTAGIKCVVTAEEHSLIGGLASIVTYALRNESKRIEAIGIKDEFGQSAHSHDELLVHYGLTDKEISEKVKMVIKF